MRVGVQYIVVIVGAVGLITSVTNIEVRNVLVFLYMCASDKSLALCSDRSDADLGLRSKGRATRGAVRGTVG